MSCEPQKKTLDDSTEKIKELAERLKEAQEKKNERAKDTSIAVGLAHPAALI